MFAYQCVCVRKVVRAFVFGCSSFVISMCEYLCIEKVKDHSGKHSHFCVEWGFGYGEPEYEVSFDLAPQRVIAFRS